MQRVAGLLPSVESSAQGADAGDAEAMELHGDLCRGLLRRAGAVEDDVAIAWDAVGEAGDLGRADAQGAGQHARVGHVVQRVAEVDYKGLRGAILVGFVEHRLQLFGLETEFADLGDEAALFDQAPDEEADDHQDEDEHGEVAE